MNRLYTIIINTVPFGLIVYKQIVGKIGNCCQSKVQSTDDNSAETDSKRNAPDVEEEVEPQTQPPAVDPNQHHMKGLDNLGNTCYMNSTLQALFAIPELRRPQSDRWPPTDKTRVLHRALVKLFRQLESGHQPMVTTAVNAVAVRQVSTPAYTVNTDGNTTLVGGNCMSVGPSTSSVNCKITSKIMSNASAPPMMAHDYSDSISGANDSTSGATAAVADELKTSIEPEEFWKTFVAFKKEFESRVQYDAQEFLRFLIDGLHEEVNCVVKRPRRSTTPPTANQVKTLAESAAAAVPNSSQQSWRQYVTRVDRSYLVDLFVGQFQSTIRCTHCDHQSYCWDSFWDISVPVLTEWTDGEKDINDCIGVYVKDEYLRGDAEPTCERCRRKRPSIKTMNFSILPLILIVHLKKFANDGHKVSKTVKINTELTIAGIGCLANYGLFACINHRGYSCSSGHYTAHCLHDQLWYELDDETVWLRDSTNAIDWNVMSGAYILFYRKVGQ